MNDNENTTYQNIWDTARAALNRKSFAINACIKKEESSQINNLISTLRQSEQRTKYKASRRK